MSLHALDPQRFQVGPGVPLLVVPMPHAHRVVVSAHLKIGSRYETERDNGLSHFLEHMLYRGTPRYPTAHDQALAFEELGGTLYAETGMDGGTLTVSVPRENFERALELFSGVYLEPVFDGIEVEKGIVREEILEDLDEKGHQVDADTLLCAQAFSGHALGRPIVGTLAHVDRFDVEALTRHHRAFYTTGTSTIVIAGPIEADSVRAAVDRAFAKLPVGAPPTSPPPPAPAGPHFRFVRNSSSQTALRMGFRAPSARDALEPATEVLVRLLDDGLSTRLYHRICDEKGLCYDVSADYESFDDCGLFDLAAETSHDTAARVLEEFVRVVRELRDEGPTERELERIQARCRWQLEEMLDSPSEVADFYGAEALVGSGRTALDRANELSRVNRDGVIEAARNLFRAEGLSVVAVGLQSRKARDALGRVVEAFPAG